MSQYTIHKHYIEGDLKKDSPAYLRLDRFLRKELLLDTDLSEKDPDTIPRYALLNAKEMPNIDKESIGLLLNKARCQLRERNGHLAICSLSDRVERKVNQMKLDTIFEIYDTEEEALEFLKKEIEAENPWARF